jgi:hypothetical protein
MTRLIPPGIAFVLVVTACDAGAKPASQALEVSAHAPRTVHRLVVVRRAAAAREAETLLRRFVPPPGSTPLSHSPSAGPLIYPGLVRPADVELVGRHDFWQVDELLADVVGFVKAPRLRGFRWDGTSHSTGVSGPAYTAFDFDGPGRRQLSVTAVRLAGRTVLRVDAGAVWNFPRSPREVVPRSVRAVNVRAPGVSVRVTRTATVARIVRWLDGLAIVQPGVTSRCGTMLPSPTVTLDFLDGRGVRLASAKAPARGYSTVCNAIRFSIRGRDEMPLLGADFTARLARLLDVRFSAPG